MIDPATGTVQFAAPALRITAGLTRKQFLASDAGRSAQSLVANEPWHSWVPQGTYESEGRFTVALYFKGEKLESLHMEASGPEFGTSWEDYTPDKIKLQQKAHEAWLTRWLGTEREFRWGTAWAGFDQKGGFALIVIRYS